MFTLTILVEHLTEEEAKAGFRALVESLSDELISADETTLTVRVRKA